MKSGEQREITDDRGLPSAVLGEAALAPGILPCGGGAQVGKAWQIPPKLYARQDTTLTGWSLLHSQLPVFCPQQVTESPWDLPIIGGRD